jgi:hypothetical protein
MRKPKKSLIWVLAMRMAMPFVKPMITGRGKYLTAAPIPVAPRMRSSKPAIIVHVNRPSIPYLAMIPETTTTNPVGPPICVFEPPSAEIKKPVTIASIDARLRRNSRRDGESHGQRQGDQPDGDACNQITQEFAAIVITQ